MGRRKKPQTQAGKQLPLMRWGLADVYAKARDLIGLNQDEIAKQAGLQRKLVGRIERGDESVGQGNRRKVAAALGVPFQDLERLGHRLALASGTPVTTHDAKVIQEAQNTGEGSLVKPRSPVQAGESTPQEGAPMIANHFGKAVIDLMSGFKTEDQFIALHDAATAIAKGGRNHAPKEGLSS